MLVISCWKVFSFLRFFVFIFVSWLFGYVEKRLDKNAMLNLKILPFNGYQIIKIHILSNISKRKDNQAIKFGHLIECSVRTIFLQKSISEWGRETSFRPPFLKKKCFT